MEYNMLYLWCLWLVAGAALFIWAMKSRMPKHKAHHCFTTVLEGKNGGIISEDQVAGRTAQILHENKGWFNIEFIDLKDGDVFRLFDGSKGERICVEDKEGFRLFKAVGNVCNHDKIPTIYYEGIHLEVH